MNKLARIIQSLEYKELRLLEKDLYEGNIGSLIKKRLQEFEPEQKTCPTCGNSVGEDSYLLQFGSAGFRKQARFCGLDCLKFFLEKLEKVH